MSRAAQRARMDEYAARAVLEEAFPEPTIDEIMFARRLAWLKAKAFGLRHTIELPPMNYEQSHAARESAFSALYNPAERACGNRDLYTAQIGAIELAEQQNWRRRSRSRSGNRAPANVTARLRQAILIRDGDECWLCGRPMGDDCTLEHLNPVSLGGTNAPANLALAHRDCNVALGDRPLKAKVEMRRTVRKGRCA